MRHDTWPIRATTRRPRRLCARRDICSPARSLRAVPRSHAQARGQSIVEFALAIPVFLALLFGTLEVGMLFKTRAAYQEATQQAVRAVSEVGGSDQAGLSQLTSTLAGENLNNITSVTIFDATATGAIWTPSSSSTYTYTKYTYSPSTRAFVCQPPPSTGSSCTASNTWAARNTVFDGQDHVGVAVRFAYKSVTGVIPPFTMAMTATAEMEPTSY